MSHALKCVLLIDDNPDDNFFHERAIRKSELADQITARLSANSALDYLSEGGSGDCFPPDLIFLDINMPGMNGWEFLEEFEQLNEVSDIKVIILTTSENPDDQEKAGEFDRVTDFRIKPLTTDNFIEIVNTHFNN